MQNFICMKTIAIVGSGTGGIALANKLYARLKDEIKKNEVKIVVFDKKDYHIYYPGLLFYSLGLLDENELTRKIKELLPPDIEVNVNSEGEVKQIDLENRRIKAVNGKEYTYDYLVISTGVEYNWSKIKGLKEGMISFYELDGAKKIRDLLKSIKGTVVVNVARFPYPCIPAPIEFAILLKDILKENVKVVYTSPVAPDDYIENIFTAKGIEDRSPLLVDFVDTSTRIIRFQEGEELKYDFLIGVPPSEGTSLAKSLPFSSRTGWLTVDKSTLRPLDYDEVYAIGDAADFPGMKTASSAISQADVVSMRIAEEIKGGEAKTTYDGLVTCFIITGLGMATASIYNYKEHLPYPPQSEMLWYFAYRFDKIYWDLLTSSLKI